MALKAEEAPKILRKGRRYPREQLEDHKFGVAELLFDIVPRDPTETACCRRGGRAIWRYDGPSGLALRVI
jgi:hypothetical protein